MKQLLFLISLLFLLSCTTYEENNALQIIPVPNIQCDTCKYPIIMVHGFLASGDTWTKYLQYFTSNGYKGNLIFAFDWNSLAQGTNTSILLDQFIDQVLIKTKREKVRLIGHSAGGGVCYTYLSDSTRASKVDGYVHIGSSTQPGPAGPKGSIATLNIWSAGDKISTGRNINGAVNIELITQDHYQIATSKESFAAVYKFFHNLDPTTLEITKENPVCIVGRMLTFGENKPVINGNVEIYILDPNTGERISSTPLHQSNTDSLGYWKAVNVDPDVPYELVAIPSGTNQRIIHYFREGFTHLNTFVYLRTLPPQGSLAGLLLAGLPNTSTQSVLNVFSSSQAVVSGRDSLWVDANYISTNQFASDTKTAISFFIYDDGDSKTELIPVGLFGTFSFLSGVDLFVSPNPARPISVLFNKRKLNIRNIASDKGLVIAVFD